MGTTPHERLELFGWLQPRVSACMSTGRYPTLFVTARADGASHVPLVHFSTGITLALAGVREAKLPDGQQMLRGLWRNLSKSVAAGEVPLAVVCVDRSGGHDLIAWPAGVAATGIEVPEIRKASQEAWRRDWLREFDSMSPEQRQKSLSLAAHYVLADEPAPSLTDVDLKNIRQAQIDRDVHAASAGEDLWFPEHLAAIEPEFRELVERGYYPFAVITKPYSRQGATRLSFNSAMLERLARERDRLAVAADELVRTWDRVIQAQAEGDQTVLVVIFFAFPDRFDFVFDPAEAFIYGVTPEEVENCVDQAKRKLLARLAPQN